MLGESRVAGLFPLGCDELSAPDATEHIGEVLAHGNVDFGPDGFRAPAIAAELRRSDGHRTTPIGRLYRGVGVMVDEHGVCPGVACCGSRNKGRADETPCISDLVDRLRFRSHRNARCQQEVHLQDSHQERRYRRQYPDRGEGSVRRSQQADATVPRL